LHQIRVSIGSTGLGMDTKWLFDFLTPISESQAQPIRGLTAETRSNAPMNKVRSGGERHERHLGISRTTKTMNGV
jgi:hypothetical protein